jgi:heme exporter protein B
MIQRQLRLLFFQGDALLGAFSFFALALFCASLAIGPQENVLRQSAPGILWILFILTTLFSMPLLLKGEAKEGLLDEIVLHPSPAAFYLLSKIGAEWLLIGLPLIALGILLSPLFSLSNPQSLRLALTLLISFPALSGLGILGGLLTLNARGGGILLAFLILPLTIPLFLFGLSIFEMIQFGLDSSAAFCLLTSVSILLVMLSVAIGSWALRFAVEG